MCKDPVCGMQVDESKAAAKSEFKGKSYCFCGTKCKETFDKEPSKYSSKEGADSKKHEHQHH